MPRRLQQQTTRRPNWNFRSKKLEMLLGALDLALEELTTASVVMMTPMLLKINLISYPSVSTSHTCGIILWAGFLEEAKNEVDKLHEH